MISKSKLIMKPKLSLELAEVCGLVSGDGHLSKYKSDRRTDYKLIIVGHFQYDKEYLEDIKNILDNILNKKGILKKKHNSIQLIYNSKYVVDLFNDLGIPSGNKSETIKIPKEILQNLEYSFAFLRGFADADFSLVIKKRKTKKDYPRITCDIKSKLLIEDICSLLDRIKINFCGPYKRTRTRKDTKYTTYQIDINGHENFNIWMKHISFRNPKHLNKIKKNGVG